VILQDDSQLRTLLRTTQRVAVLGAKARREDVANRVPRAMQSRGYQILPVNPKFESLLGKRCAPRLAEVEPPIDLVNIFRATPHIPGHTDEILALRPLPQGVWLQLGIRDDTSAQRLADQGIQVVQDRCLWVEHLRLLGDGEIAP